MRTALLLALCVCSVIAHVYPVSTLDLDLENYKGGIITAFFPVGDKGIVCNSQSILLYDLSSFRVIKQLEMSDYYNGFVGGDYFYAQFDNGDPSLKKIYIANLTIVGDYDLSEYGYITAGTAVEQYAFLGMQISVNYTLIKLDLESAQIIKSRSLDLPALSLITNYNQLILYDSQHWILINAETLQLIALVYGAYGTYYGMYYSPGDHTAYYSFGEDGIVLFNVDTFSVDDQVFLYCTSPFAIFYNDTGYCVFDDTVLYKIDLTTMYKIGHVDLSTYGDSYPYILYYGTSVYLAGGGFGANVLKVDGDTLEVEKESDLLRGYNSLVALYSGEYAYFGSYSVPATVVQVNPMTFQVEQSIQIPNEHSLIFGMTYGNYLFFTTYNVYSRQSPPTIVRVRTMPFEYVDKMTIDGRNIISTTYSGQFGYVAYHNDSGTVLATLDLEAFQIVSTTTLEFNGTDLFIESLNVIGNYLYIGAADFEANLYKWDLTSKETVDSLSLMNGFDIYQVLSYGDYFYMLTGNGIEKINPKSFTVIEALDIPNYTSSVMLLADHMLFVPDQYGYVNIVDLSMKNMTIVESVELPSQVASGIYDGSSIFLGSMLPSGDVYRVKIPTDMTSTTTGELSASESVHYAFTGLFGVCLALALFF